MKSLAIALSALVGLSACSSISNLSQSFTNKGDDSLDHVDGLLSRIERVQAESLVSKERADAALETLRVLVAPEFRGDAMSTHAALLDAIKLSDVQADRLRASVEPMKKLAESVFERWTKDLESFGNTSMRQRSQVRLEETRARYEDIVTAAVRAQIAYDAYNATLRDHALFLGNDMNAAAIAEIVGDVEKMGVYSQELDRRLEACAAACRTYVDAYALRGQVEEAPAGEVAPTR